MSDLIALHLTLQQLETLSDKLHELRDEGPDGMGWASPELSELRSLVDARFYKVKAEGNTKETDTCRSRPEGGLKQASGEPLNPVDQKYCLDLYNDVSELFEFAYEKFKQVGLSPEQARMLLAKIRETDNA